MSLDLIRTIVKQRWETGAYGSAHFQMPRALLDDFPPREPDTTSWLPNPLGDMLSIPVVVKDSLPHGQWRLVDTHTNEILAVGTVGADDEERLK